MAIALWDFIKIIGYMNSHAWHSCMCINGCLSGAGLLAHTCTHTNMYGQTTFS